MVWVPGRASWTVQGLRLPTDQCSSAVRIIWGFDEAEALAEREWVTG